MNIRLILESQKFDHGVEQMVSCMQVVKGDGKATVRRNVAKA